MRLLPTYTIFAQTKTIFQKHSNKLRLYPFTNQEITKTPQTIDLSQFCLFFSKPLEKHIDKHLLSSLKTNEFIHPDQSGFREHHSCHTALTTLVDDTFYKNINNNQFTGVRLVDFAKAFDVIDHELLLRKLALYGLSSDTLQLIS